MQSPVKISVPESPLDQMPDEEPLGLQGASESERFPIPECRRGRSVLCVKVSEESDLEGVIQPIGIAGTEVTILELDGQQEGIDCRGATDWSRVRFEVLAGRFCAILAELPTDTFDPEYRDYEGPGTCGCRDRPQHKEAVRD